MLTRKGPLPLIYMDAFLEAEPFSAPECSDDRVVYCRECLVDHSDPSFIAKAIIDTPKGKDGRVDLDSVPEGASVWITVTNPSSPLHGRPILITKRPDGLFALTGGAGQDADARRHMVLTGSPKKTRRTKELEDEIEETEAHNAPLLAAQRQVTAQSQRELREAAAAMMASVGLRELDKAALRQRRDDIQNYVEQALGEDRADEAKRLTDAVMKQALSAEKVVRDRTQRDRQLKVLRNALGRGERLGGTAVESDEVAEGEELTDPIEEVAEPTPIAMLLPDVGALEGLTGPQQQLEIARHFDAQVEDYFDPEREAEALPEYDHDSPTLPLGESVGPMEIDQPEKLDEAISKVQEYWDKRREVGQLREQLRQVPMQTASASTLSQVKAEELAPVSLADLEDMVEQDMQRKMRDNSAVALYDAVGEHWNSETDLTERLIRGRKDSAMQFHVNAGAATALSAMGKEFLGKRYDVAKLVTDGNIELAAASLALEAARTYASDSDEYAEMVDRVREYNATNQRVTEQLALEQHRRYVNQYSELQSQKESGELLDQVAISHHETDNLIRQRTNLGSALGSLQSSATFYDYLERLKGAKRSPVVGINVGEFEGTAESLRAKLGLKNNYEVDMSDPSNITLNVNLASLSKHVKEAPDISAQAGRYEELKTNMEGVDYDARGNMVVDNYDVPGWRSTFTDAAGEEQSYKWRVEQRNDMEWLKAATESSDDNPDGIGGGLITRVTGAGKTNTALGFYAHKIKENPDYRGLVTVPKGRAAQWKEEADRFTDMNVVLIPDGTRRDEVASMLAVTEPGTITVMGHREAAQAHETLNELQTNEEFADQKFHGLVIDEPQELQSRGQSGNIGALGKRLMKSPFNHRVALTATPARRNPTEAYDLIKWTQGSSKALGSKAGFARTFSGFGEGTNAQDSAINKLFFDTISPFISGDRLTTPEFKVNRTEMPVRRSEEQRSRQVEIEQGSADYVTRRRQELMQEARDNPRSSMRTGVNWENTLPRRATERARQELRDQHADNMDGGDFRTNAKLQNLRQTIETSGDDQKHVVYVSSAAQRRALGEMFRDMGMSQRQVKNLAGGTGAISGEAMSARARAFQQDPDARVVMIDKTSSSGYNLQAGNALHVVGAPTDAATYLQSQGRVARAPRVGDVNIHTYRYEDVASDFAHYNDIDAQLKILQASSPAMFV